LSGIPVGELAIPQRLICGLPEQTYVTSGNHDDWNTYHLITPSNVRQEKRWWH